MSDLSNEELRALMDGEARNAEAARGLDQDAPLPPGTKVSRPNRPTGETLQQRLDRIAAEAEAAEADQTERPIPPHVKVSRPNRAN